MNHLHNILVGFSLIEMTGAVKERASNAFPTAIGTLDAIHLSSALIGQEHTDEEVLILTFDGQMLICAGALGIQTYSG